MSYNAAEIAEAYMALDGVDVVLEAGARLYAQGEIEKSARVVGTICGAMSRGELLAFAVTAAGKYIQLANNERK